MAKFTALFLALVVCMASVVRGDDILQINAPTQNQQLTSNTQFNIQYTIIGAQAAHITNAYYFNSMAVEFRWTQKNNESNVIELNAASGLVSDPAPAGIANKQYSTLWKVPGCHFFHRYSPNDYNFELIFTPQYSALAANQVAPGPQQEPITVPVTINVNDANFPKC